MFLADLEFTELGRLVKKIGRELFFLGFGAAWSSAKHPLTDSLWPRQGGVYSYFGDPMQKIGIFMFIIQLFYYHIPR